MWRFIVISFAFLGWSFYEMSGGSDYEPALNSLQTRVGPADAQAPQVDVVQLDSNDEPADGVETVTRALTTLSDLDVEDGNRFQITLASVDASNDYNADSVAQTDVTEAVAAAIAADVAEASAADVAVADAEPNVPDSVATGFIGEEVFSLETYVMRQDSGYTPTAEASLQGVDTDSDIRQVSGNSVNMRAGPGTDYQRVGRLTKGTQITVLEEPGNGWVMLEVVATGETGWMADWLITASN